MCGYTLSRSFLLSYRNITETCFVSLISLLSLSLLPVRSGLLTRLSRNAHSAMIGNVSIYRYPEVLDHLAMLCIMRLPFGACVCRRYSVMLYP
jgi:uncharacterized membrane protein